MDIWWGRPCGCAESAPHELVRLSLPIVRGLQRLDQLDGARALALQLGKYSISSSHLVRVRACCGLWRAMREVFEVEVVQVVGPAVRRLRGGSFVCASGVLAVDVAADCDTIAGPQRSFVTPRPGVVPAWAHNLRLVRP